MKIRFSKLSEERDPTSMTMTLRHESWPEILDDFIKFLNAAGFSIEREHIQEWADR